MSGSHRRPATAPDAAAAKAVTRTGRGGHQHDVRTLHRNVQGSSALCGEWWPGKSRRKGRGRLAGAYAPQTPVAQPVRGAHVPPTSILGKRTSTLLQAQRLNQHPPLQPNKSTRAPVPTLVRTSAPAASASPTPRPPCRPAPCLAEVGDRARGIAVINHTTTVAEIERLDRLGVRGARFHMLPGGAVGWESLEPVSAAIAGFGWHIQVQLNGRELPERIERLLALPVNVVVDHVGRFTPPVPVDDGAFLALCRLLDEGSAWVKISAPYESDPAASPDYPEVATLARTLISHYPERMLWATNWPHPGQAVPPSTADLRNLLDDWIPPEHRQTILVDNPVRLYGFD